MSAEVVNRSVRLAECREHPGNYQKHSAQQVKDLGRSLAKFGQVRSIVVQDDSAGGFVIVAGHGLASAARAAGYTELRADVIPADWPAAKVLAYLAADNELARQSDPDEAQLAALVAQVQAVDAELASLAAGSEERLKELMASLNGSDADDDPGAQVDQAAELQAKWGTALDQLWQLGEHRLVCGDCTDAAVVARVMQGEKATTVTDPPYGVGVDYESFDDTAHNVKELIGKIMPVILDNLPAALTPGVPAMWDYPKPVWVGSWTHPAPTSSGPWGFIGSNPILYYGKDPYLAEGKGRRDSSLVAVADRMGENDHPVSKPLNVWLWLIERMTPDSGQIVLDPFLGSGTTLIACERLGRKCRAVELEPKYVAVALERWAVMTGKTPVLLEPAVGADPTQGKIPHADGA